jgi:PAS domain S-box-containing protein
MPPQERPFARALRGERFSNYVVHIRRVDTGKFWDGSYTGTLVRDERGKPILVLVTVRDITEHEQIEEALQISEDRLRVAVQEAGIGTWHWDIRANQRQWSARCKALFGLLPDEDVTFDRFLQALHPDDRQRTQAAMTAALLEKSRYEIQHRAVWPDGSEHWIMSVGYGHYDSAGDPLYIEGIARPLDAIPHGGESSDEGHFPVRLPD